MHLLDPNELNRVIGKKSLFKSQNKLGLLLDYESGISDFDTLIKREEPIKMGLTQHPRGLKIYTSDKNKATGISYDDLKGYTLNKSEFRELVFLSFLHSSKQEVSFSFKSDLLKKVMVFIRKANIKEYRKYRTEEEIRASIETLREHFKEPKPSSISISEMVTDTSGAFGTVRPFELTNDSISWKERTLLLENATGFSYGIFVNKVEGITTSRDYNIIIHEKNGNPMRIGFSGMKNGDIESFYSQVIDTLLHLLSFREIDHWLAQFIENKTVTYDLFSLDRQGVNVKQGRRTKRIPWEDLRIYSESFYMFFSLYDREARLQLDGNYDRRANMLEYFNRWLLHDEDRLKALLG